MAPDMIAMRVASVMTGRLAYRQWRNRDEPASQAVICARGCASLWAANVVVALHLAEIQWKLLLSLCKPFALLGLASALLVLVVEMGGAARNS